MTTDVINGVPRELLERISKNIPGDKDFHHALLTAQWAAIRELRALLATAQPADHSEHDLNMVSQPAADGERAQFEAAFRVPHPNVPLDRYDAEQYPANEYRVGWVHEQWGGWQMARAAQPAKAEGVADASAMADRFISWPLPASVRPDPCAMNPEYPHRYGTNLLTWAQAKAMFEYVLAAPVPPVRGEGGEV